MLYSDKMSKHKTFIKFVSRRIVSPSLREVARSLSRLDALCEEITSETIKGFTKEDERYLKNYMAVFLTKLLYNSKIKMDLKAFEKIGLNFIHRIALEAQNISKNERSDPKTTKETLED